MPRDRRVARENHLKDFDKMFREATGYVEDKTLLDEVQEWMNRKPVPPATSPPTYQRFEASEIGMPLAAIGGIIGFLIFISLLANNSEWVTLGLVAFIGLPFVLPVGYVLLGIAAEEIRRLSAKHEEKRTGWFEYYEAYDTWKKEKKPFEKRAIAAGLEWDVDILMDT